jgi:type I restriction enzyme R subunit
VLVASASSATAGRDTHLRVLVKRLLREHKYPPDKQEKAIQTVIEQAELICKDWVAA